MSDAVRNARARRAALLAEVRDIDAFLGLHEHFSGLTDAAVHAAPSGRRERVSGRPALVYGVIVGVLSCDAPFLTLEEIVAQLVGRGIALPECAKGYVATILWRHRHEVEHVRGHGYRLRGDDARLSGEGVNPQSN